MQLLFSTGSESPAGFDIGGLSSVTGGAIADGKINPEGDRYRQMAKLLIGGGGGSINLEDKPHLSNEISAPYEVPQYPIEQIETKLIR